MGICLLASAASARCPVTGLQVVWDRIWRREGGWAVVWLMLLLHSPPVKGMPPNTQPRSVVVSLGAISSSLFGESGKTSSLRKPRLRGQHIPSSRKEMGLQGSPPLGVPGSAGVPVQTPCQFTLDLLSPFPGLIVPLPKPSSFFTKKSLLQDVKEAHRLPTCPSSLHPLSQLLPTSSPETASVLISPSILRKLPCHVSALRHRHITNRGLRPAGLEIHFGCLLWYLADAVNLGTQLIPRPGGGPREGTSLPLGAAN